MQEGERKRREEKQLPSAGNRAVGSAPQAESSGSIIEGGSGGRPG